MKHTEHSFQRKRITMAQENELINVFHKDTKNSMVNWQIRLNQLNSAKLWIIFKVCRH